MSKLTNLLEIAARSRLEPEARPFRIDVPKAREAFLLLHGFTGIPREVSKAAGVLSDAGYTCYAPRYPGHGTNRADFLASTAEDWVRRAADSYMELSSEYEEVHVLGHSMGGLIAASVAAAFDAPLLILLAPAFRLTNRQAVFAPFIAPILPVLRKNRPLSDDETDPVRRRLYADYWADDLVSGAAYLERIRRTAIGFLPRIRSKVLVVVGDADDTVLPSVDVYLKKALTSAASFDSKTIPGAGHLFPFDKDSEKAAGIIRDWIGKFQSLGNG